MGFIRIKWRNKESLYLWGKIFFILLIVGLMCIYIPSPLSDWIDENEWVVGIIIVWVLLGSSVTDYIVGTKKERKEIIKDTMLNWVIIIGGLLFFVLLS